MRDDLDCKPGFEKETQKGGHHLHLPNTEMHYADLKIAHTHRNTHAVQEASVREAGEDGKQVSCTQGFYKEYLRTARRKCNIIQSASLSNKARVRDTIFMHAKIKHLLLLQLNVNVFLQLLLNY